MLASFVVEEARKALQILSNADPIVFMSLGYPAGNPGKKECKPLSELVSYETWGNRIDKNRDIMGLEF